MRSGQVTVFVLLGLVILITVSVFLYTALTISEQRQERRTDQVEEQVGAVSQLNKALQSCVEANIDEAMEKVFRQGGVLYKDQNGSLPRQNTTEYNGVEVRLGLLDEYPCPAAKEEKPAYPAPNLSFSEYKENYTDTCLKDIDGYTIGELQGSAGYLGFVTFPRSCNILGPNYQPNIDSEFVNQPRCGMVTARDVNNSLEKHLSDAAREFLKECTANQTLVNTSTTVIERNGTPRVNVSYAPNTTTLKVLMPVRVLVEEKAPTIMKHTFSYTDSIPLLDTWSAVYRAVQQDAKNPGFNLSESLREQFNVSHNWTDNISMYDVGNNLTINGTDLQVLLGVENRPPAVNYINRYPNNDSLHIVIEALDNLNLQPKVIDPDDQVQPTRNYSGFGEDHTAARHGQNSRLDPGEPFTEAPNDSTGIQEPGNRLSVDGEHRVLDPYAWGLYTTRVEALENGTVGDYQDVKILVVDKPRLNFTVRTSDGPMNFSEEDPLVLNASRSDPPRAFGEDGFYDTKWWIDGDNVVNDTITPSLGDIEPYNVSNITQVIDGLGVQGDSVNVTFHAAADTTYKDGVEHTVEKQVSVKNCMRPGGSEDSYPFSGFGNPNAEHSCCRLDGDDNEVKQPGNVCFTDSVTGNDSDVLPVLDDWEEDLQKWPSSGLDEVSDARNDVTGSDENFSVDIQRECRGVRGNVCGGEVTVTTTQQTS